MKKIKKEFKSLQDWFFVDEFFENGIIKIKNNYFIKILKITPINYNLKSELEKEAILNAYKTFLKSYQDDIQIIIQSKKEDFSKHIESIKKQNKKENSLNKKNMVNLSNQYIEFINLKNKEKNSSSKNFYILIHSQKVSENYPSELIYQDLKEKYLKIKDLLSRCGNETIEINNIEDIKNIYFSFLNIKEYFYK